MERQGNPREVFDRMRRLIVIRIVHTPSDMGSMREGIEKESRAQVGEARWDENQRRIARFWDEVEKEVLGLNLDLKKVRIYQDGLPAAGELGERIVRETAEKGSRNYQIILDLMAGGATIEATESPKLLIQEYQNIKAIVEAGTDEQRAAASRQYERIKDDLLKARDEFIARSIGSTLQDGETGLLFIGAHHNVIPHLDSDIAVAALD